MKEPVIKNAENFLPLWNCEILVEDNSPDGISLDAGKGILIGVCEDRILLRCGNVITKWVKIHNKNLKFFVTKY